ncbi:alanine/glycine:cation symporter family protein [Novipirellula sp. SH528]|uniref:alanine/glycine:cation symporter family protein n=1 Tax=Novipirellula sp. SH528 TaxID=3454466 RepID=UPI003FA0FD2D
MPKTKLALLPTSFASSVRLLPLLACVVIALCAFSCPYVAMGQDSTTAPAEVAAEPGLENAVAEPAEVTTENKPAEEESSGSEEPSWMQRIDTAFGKYVVDNAAAVIFYDFGTKDRLGVSIPFVVVWLFAGGVFLTLRMRFINFRGFRHALDLVRGVYDSPDEPGEVTHFQALAAALSATVGLGNIAGVAIAIGTGGPGATVWIILVGILGMTAKFTECTLGQLYRVTDADGHVLGGPMRYLRYGLKDIGFPGLGRVLAVVFALLCICASFGGGNSFQVGQSLEVIRDDVDILQTQPWIYGVIMAVAVGVVIIGGIKSIAAVAGKIVPIMCTAYVLAALYILAINASEVPAAIGTIVSEAFSLQAGWGAFLGVLVIGIKRAVFSNEAGIGSAAIAHSAAKTDEPVSEGIVALLEPFIDTVMVCTITALVVVVTGVYEAPNMQEVIASDQGARLTLEAFVVGGHDWFRYVLFAAVVLFAYSTCISWSYYGERCWVQLFGVRTSIIYKILFLSFTVLGSIVTRGNILAFSDLMILGMSFPNLLGVFLMSSVVKRQLDSYWKKYQNGDLQRIK